VLDQARRQGIQHRLQGRQVSSKLEEIGTVGQRNTGTRLRFWPMRSSSDTDKFSVPQLKHTLKAKAVLCPGLRITFKNEATGEKDEWFYTGDLAAYLVEELGKHERIPAEPLPARARAMTTR